MTAKKNAQANRPIPATQFNLSRIFRMALQRDLTVPNVSRVADDSQTANITALSAPKETVQSAQELIFVGAAYSSICGGY